jgi:hypothetical protein
LGRKFVKQPRTKFTSREKQEFLGIVVLLLVFLMAVPVAAMEIGELAFVDRPGAWRLFWILWGAGATVGIVAIDMGRRNKMFSEPGERKGLKNRRRYEILAWPLAAVGIFLGSRLPTMLSVGLAGIAGGFFSAFFLGFWFVGRRLRRKAQEIGPR